MLNEGRWVYQEAKTVHAYSLCRIIDAGTADERYDLLGTIEIPVDRRAPNRPGDGLRSWAIATLTSGGYGFGRYHAAFGTLDSDGEPDRDITHENIDWSGTTALLPAE